MATPYVNLTNADKFFHVNDMYDDKYDVPVSGILASGEANYYDLNQNPTTRTFEGYNGYYITVNIGSSPMFSTPLLDTEETNTSIFSPYGLYFDRTLSNARDSIDYSINDFNNFSPYIHYTPNPLGGLGYMDPYGYAFIIDTSVFLNLAVFAYNVSPK